MKEIFEEYYATDGDTSPGEGDDQPKPAEDDLLS
jgi:hypothetical protein